MISKSKAVLKLLEISETIVVGGRLYQVIPENEFTAEEIEELREHDAANYRFYKRHVYANFLPDGIRPDDVPPL